ncbi:MAG: hypothetical protein LBB80_03380 [Treponema sp.]|nr:hypothetical protein [Treponema sp.]
MEPDVTKNSLYITTASTLIEMKPSDANRSVSARLVGGNAEDIYGFSWVVANYESDRKTSTGGSYPVIEVVANADNAYIVPKEEGTAIIRVSHPKTSYKLDIRVNVKLYSAIKFSKTNVTMDMGMSTTVSIEVPTGMTAVYESTDDTVASVTGTNKVCIIEAYRAGTVIITGRNVTGTTHDEIVVKINHVDNAKVKYIQTSVNLVTMRLYGNNPMITATPVGVGSGNDAISGLRWRSLNTNIVQLGNNGIGFSQVQFIPVGVGPAEVIIEHTSMPGYVKRLYVVVNVDESIFSLSDYFIELAQNTTGRIKATVTNVPNFNYITDLEWKSDNESVV